MELQVDVVRRTEDLLVGTEAWAALCTHPEAHPALFKAVADANDDLVRPHVVIVSRDSAVIAVAVARIQYERIPLKLGPLHLPTPRLRVLRLSYDGIMGDTSPDVFAALNDALNAPLRSGEADAAFWDHMRSGSVTEHSVLSPGPNMQRDLSPVATTLHWATSMDQSFDAFLRGLSKSERANYNKNARKLEAEYGTRLRTVCYRSIEDLDVVMRDAQAISVLTYQSTLGASFADHAWARPWLKSSLELGLARCFVLYIDDKPRAFCLALVWKGRLTTHFMGYDPSLADYGVGRYVVFWMIAAACADPDIRQLDFGFGDAVYKRRVCKVSWNEVDRYVFARRFKPMMVNAVRGSIGHGIEAVDRTLKRLGLRERLKTLVWLRIKQQKADVTVTHESDASTGKLRSA